ncbi:MAG: Mov34/MPN/PAD-1 family protein [Candidatus Helarchaeota archaeon]
MVDIIIYPMALAKMIEHTSQNVHKEVAGYLIGRIPDDQTVEITDIAIARQEGTSVHVTLNDEDQALIADRLEQEGLKEVIIGWYHSHPKMGAHFFSSTDVATQKRYQFFLEQAVGLVLDPHNYVISGKPTDIDIHAWRIEDNIAKDVPFRILIEKEKVLENILTHLKRQNILKRAVSQIIYSLNPKLEQSITKMLNLNFGGALGEGRGVLVRKIVLFSILIQALAITGILLIIWGLMILLG